MPEIQLIFRENPAFFIYINFIYILPAIYVLSIMKLFSAAVRGSILRFEQICPSIFVHMYIPLLHVVKQTAARRAQKKSGGAASPGLDMFSQQSICVFVRNGRSAPPAPDGRSAPCAGTAGSALRPRSVRRRFCCAPGASCPIRFPGLQPSC